MRRDLKRRSRFADATSVSQEDYLKAIYKMQTEAGVPIGARLSEALKVTPPAVTAALKRMARNGYVRLSPRDGQIRLTAKGRSVAERLVLRHRLIEKLLTEVLGMDWKLVHGEAEKLEHAISDQVEKKLLEYFGPEGTCPHGYPLFGGESALRRQGATPLEQAEPGDRLRVVRVQEAYGFLEFLDQLQVRPGTEIEVLEKSFDDTMTLSVGPQKHHLAKSTTSRIWVRKA